MVADARQHGERRFAGGCCSITVRSPCASALLGEQEGLLVGEIAIQGRSPTRAAAANLATVTL